MFSAKVAGQWLSTVGAYGPVTVEFGLHGSEAASWEMSPKLRHPILRGNRRVEIYDGGVRIWVGTLIEPGTDGQYAARGIWKQAEGTPCLTTAGAMTTVPNDAIAGAWARGEIAWTYASTISATAWSASNGELTLANLLDGLAAELGMRWMVSPSYVVSLQADPAIPMWRVPHAVAGRGLTPAEDEFATHLVGTYLAAPGAFATETVGSSDAADAFGRRTVESDLLPMGIINAARANSVLSGMFLRAGARMGWAEGLQLSHGQITTMGAVPARLAQVQAMQMIRLAGTVDVSRAGRVPAYTDLVLAGSKYTGGSREIVLSPLGYAPRNFGEVLDARLVTA